MERYISFDPYMYERVPKHTVKTLQFLQRERERERVGTKNTLIKSLEERKKELLIERTKRNARTTRKRRKRKRKRRTKRFLRFL